MSEMMIQAHKRMTSHLTSSNNLPLSVSHDFPSVSPPALVWHQSMMPLFHFDRLLWTLHLFRSDWIPRCQVKGLRSQVRRSDYHIRWVATFRLRDYWKGVNRLNSLKHSFDVWMWLNACEETKHLLSWSRPVNQNANVPSMIVKITCISLSSPFDFYYCLSVMSGTKAGLQQHRAHPHWWVRVINDLI